MNPWPKHPVIYELNPSIFRRTFMECPLKLDFSRSSCDRLEEGYRTGFKGDMSDEVIPWLLIKDFVCL
jgi:hypothetical protein